MRYTYCYYFADVKKLPLIFVFLATALLGFAQEEGMTVRGVIVNGDTLPLIQLKPVDVWEKRTFKTKRAERKYSRLKKKVIKVYPYAKLAGVKLNEYAAVLDTVQSEKQKKKFYKEIEEQLKAEFGSELKKLSMSEGRILIKLIDRETGNTSYELVNDLRGKLTAFFWQSFARIFGHNLKDRYDPEGDDREIEFIVQQIEAGLI